MQLLRTHLPQDEDVLEGKLSLEPDEQPAETEAKRAAVLRVWWTKRKKEGWAPFQYWKFSLKFLKTELAKLNTAYSSFVLRKFMNFSKSHFLFNAFMHYNMVLIDFRSSILKASATNFTSDLILF